MYNIYQLRQYANKFLKENYDMELAVPLDLNGRMKTTCGWLRSRRFASGRNTPIKIELNKFFVENNEPTVVLDVLRHELVHYVLCAQGKPYSDGHPVFENELKRLKIVSQSTIDKYKIESKPVSMSVYECLDCGREYKRQRALPNGGRNHSCHCNGNLLDKGKKVVNA